VPGSYSVVANPIQNGMYIFSYRDSGRSLPITRVDLKLVSSINSDQYLVGPRIGNKRFLLSLNAISKQRVRSGGAQRFSGCVASASILDTAELRNFNSLLARAPLQESYFISLSDTGVEGRFRWATGDSLRYNNWALGEPGPGPENDYVVATQPSGLWMDADSTTAYPYAAEVACNFRIEGLPRQPVCLLNGLIPLSIPFQFLVEGACEDPNAQVKLEAGIIGSNFSSPLQLASFNQVPQGYVATPLSLPVGRYALRLVLSNNDIISLKDSLEIAPGRGQGPGSLVFGTRQAEVVGAGPYPKQWYRNGVPIAGATDSVYIDTIAASVSDQDLSGLFVTIGYPGCQYTLFDLRLGTKPKANKGSVQLAVVPNPSQPAKGAMLQIISQSAGIGKCSLQITSSNGKLCHSSNINISNLAQDIALPTLPSGLYAIRLVSAKMVLGTKWLVQPY
jgi:hypothetical protein